jgi:FkbM family methyltransferase
MSRIANVVESFLWRAVVFAGDFRVFGLSALWLGIFPGMGFLIRRSGREGVAKKIKVKSPAGSLYIRLLSSDTPTLRAVYVKQVYDISNYPQDKYLTDYYESAVNSGKTPLIIDCGANIGLAACWFAQKFPKAKIIAIEPEASNYSLLCRNTEPYKNVHCLNGAILDHNSNVMISNPSAEHWAFQVAELPAQSAGGIPAFAISDILSLMNSDEIMICKIDIEGAERELFRSNNDWIIKTKVIMIEFHDRLYPGEGASRAALRCISQYKFDMIQKSENLCFIRC